MPPVKLRIEAPLDAFAPGLPLCIRILFCRTTSASDTQHFTSDYRDKLEGFTAQLKNTGDLDDVHKIIADLMLDNDASEVIDIIFQKVLSSVDVSIVSLLPS